jgi:23S rRNA (uracil1939-C5)-methyltransferase
MQTDTHKIKAFAEQYNIQRITSGNSEIFKSQEPMIFFNNIKVPYPPKTFLQPSKQSEEKIIETVLNMLSQKHYNKIADIFSGLGLFSSYLKDYCDEIFATDCDELAIKQLLKIAHSYHFNINAKTNDLFKHPIKSEKLNDFDLIVIDPPRDGAKSQTTEIAKSNVNEIIYISCNPIAFKTDAKILIDAGYTLQEITPIDQFTNTKHIELIAKFQKD